MLLSVAEDRTDDYIFHFFVLYLPTLNITQAQ